MSSIVSDALKFQNFIGACLIEYKNAVKLGLPQCEIELGQNDFEILNDHKVQLWSISLKETDMIEDYVDDLDEEEEEEKTYFRATLTLWFNNGHLHDIRAYSRDSFAFSLQKAFAQFLTVKRCSNCHKVSLNEKDKCTQCFLLDFRNVKEEYCSICLESTTCYITLPCGEGKHCFHRNCFLRIRTKHKEVNNEWVCCRPCPMCRTDILFDGQKYHAI